MKKRGRYPRFLNAGDCALVVELGGDISPTINEQVNHFLLDYFAGMQAIYAIIPTYRSLAIRYDPKQIGPQALRKVITDFMQQPGKQFGMPYRRWHIPVCYGQSYGEDLDFIAQTHGITSQEVINLHSQTCYRVYMIGFLPGFAYLGELTTQLHTPRRHQPRAMTPASSISIGGQQTAISSIACPSGWHLIGRSPWQTFNLARKACPFLLQAGDEVQFYPIKASQFDKMASAGQSAHFSIQPDWIQPPKQEPSLP